jgi:hypothetical protein
MGFYLLPKKCVTNALTYYGSAFLGQILDPIVLLAGVGWSISKVKTAPN